MRRILLVALVMAMVLSLVSPALAADEGSLTITKILMDRVAATNQLGDNDGRQIDPITLPSGAAFLNGVTFEIIRVVPMNPQPTPPAVGTYWCADDSQWYEPAPSAAAQTVTTSGGGVAFFDDLPYGIYYVRELPSSLVADSSAPFFVSIPTIIDDDGTDVVLDHVFAYPKNEDIGIKKYVIANDTTDAMAKGVSIGDTVSYRLYVDVPTDIGAAKAFRIVDTYDVGLRFAAVSSVTAPAVGGKPALTGKTTGPFSVTEFEYTITSVATDGGQLTITIPPGADNANFKKLAGYEELIIVVQFIVQDSASLTQPMENGAQLIYRNRYDHEITRPTARPRIWTGGIKIFKHDSVIENLGLQGAQFVLVPKSAAQAGETAMQNYLRDAGTITAGMPANAYVQKGVVYVATSDANGVVEFKGIPYGTPGTSAYANTPSEYWLVETVVPTGGYRKPGGVPMIVTISQTSWTGAPLTLAGTLIGNDFGGHVGNVKGFTFPLTGGAGTLVFLVGGLALAGLSAGSWRLSRKEKKTA